MYVIGNEGKCTQMLSDLTCYFFTKILSLIVIVLLGIIIYVVFTFQHFPVHVLFRFTFNYVNNFVDCRYFYLVNLVNIFYIVILLLFSLVATV